MNNLITALRTELVHYGEMLALLDQQQSLVAARAADQLLESATLVQEQTVTLHAARAHRDECRRELAVSLKLAEDTKLRDLADALAAEYRPLVLALVEENNTLLRRVQQRVRQNHLLLSRSVELMQGLLTSLLNGGTGPAYQPDGSAAQAAPVGALTCNAVA